MRDDLDDYGEPAPEGNLFLWLVIGFGIAVLGLIAWWLQ